MFANRDDPRLTVHTGCGMEFMRQHTNEFDVIITDSSDPIGPANVLFESPYYRLLHTGKGLPAIRLRYIRFSSALRDNGVICSQGETYWGMISLIKQMKSDLSSIFSSVAYGVVGVPTYPNGHIGYFICSKVS